LANIDVKFLITLDLDRAFLEILNGNSYEKDQKGSLNLIKDVNKEALYNLVKEV
jgi:hypothetical protein